MKKVFLIAAFVCAWLAAPVFAQTGNLPFNLRLGDDVATVKAKLGTEIEPEPMAGSPALSAAFRDPNKGKTILHLRTKGVWAFFNKNGITETLRFDAPFSGSVKGIKLGDTEKKLSATLGKPLSTPKMSFLTMQAHKYVLDDSAYITFHLNDDGVQYIFVTR